MNEWPRMPIKSKEEKIYRCMRYGTFICVYREDRRVYLDRHDVVSCEIWSIFKQHTYIDVG